MTMSPALAVIGKQLLQWPPTISTLAGAAILIGLCAFESAGGFSNYKASVPAGLGAMGAFAKICPQASPAIDRVSGSVEAATDVVTTIQAAKPAA